MHTTKRGERKREGGRMIEGSEERRRENDRRERRGRGDLPFMIRVLFVCLYDVC